MSLTAKIERDLMICIESGGELPCKLTLADLSRHYCVSMTPVRIALRGLLAKHFLTKQANGQYAVRPQRNHRRRAPLREVETAAPATTTLDDALARELIERSLRGTTEYLREEATADRYGVGRTAIRQAFSRLAGQGLIEHVPRCGWRVRPFDAAEMAAYLEVREALELKALELALPHLVPADLAEMRAGNPPTAADDPPRLDNQLHRYLVEKSGNPYIRDFFARHGGYFTTLFDHAAPETAVVAEMAAQHRAILDALLRHDAPAAREALARHIRGQRPIIENLLARLHAAHSK